jgi:hypothetical protein
MVAFCDLANMTDASALLTVAIATTSSRVASLQADRLPSIVGLKYQIFVQGEVLPDRADLLRHDIAFALAEGHGAARNRNAALASVGTPYLLFADDDLTFSPEGLTALLSRFEAEPEADFLCLRLADETGQPRKRYSPDGMPVRWWNCGKVGTPELAVRAAAFAANGLGFDTAFGAGVPDYLGDEYIFLCDALRAGLRGRHVALTVASHPALSSGTRPDPRAMDIRRRVLIRALGPWKSRPVRLVFALRHRKQFADWRAFLRFL